MSKNKCFLIRFQEKETTKRMSSKEFNDLSKKMEMSKIDVVHFALNFLKEHVLLEDQTFLYEEEDFNELNEEDINYIRKISPASNIPDQNFYKLF